MQNTVRLGFIGTGGMGQCAHLANFARLPDCEVVALAELRPEVARNVARRYGVPRVYSSHEELLASEELDAIVAAQPFSRHGVLIPQLLRAKKPIMIEKPLAGSVEQGMRILEAVRASGAWLMVGYHKRSDPATVYAKAEIERLKQTGELGAMKFVRLVMPPGDWIAGGFADLITSNEPYPSLEDDAPPSDMDAETYARYTQFVNYYIHQVNLMRHLLGESYRVDYADPAGTLLVARSESGVTGVIEMSTYHTTVDWQESALVTFEKGWVQLELPAPVASFRPGRVRMLRDPGNAVPEEVSPHLPWVHAMHQQAGFFVQSVQGLRKPPCEAAEALEDLRVAREYLRLHLGC